MLKPLDVQHENELKALTLGRNRAELSVKKAESENQQKAISLLNKDKELQLIEVKRNAQALKQQRIITYSISIGGILVLILLLFAFISYKKIQKANYIIKKQKHFVEEKQKEIIDSITYAKRIQTALITSEKYIDKNLNRLNKS